MPEKITINLDQGFIDIDDERTEFDKSSCKIMVQGKDFPLGLVLECEK